MAITKRSCWKILVVDDDEEIHNITSLIVETIAFEGIPVQCIHSSSEEETRKILREEKDIAVILLDVVMEKEDSGLRLVQWIREKLNNSAVRIILRTGQPGYAPQLEVIKEYDINDYKEKTELTAQKLTTVIISSLRSYNQLNSIERNQQDLGKIIRGTSSLFESYSLETFSHKVLSQFNDLLEVAPVLPAAPLSGLSLEKNREGMFVLSKIGDYRNKKRDAFPDDFEPGEVDIIQSVLSSKKGVVRGDFIATYFIAHNDREGIMLLKGNGLPRDINLDIVTLFSLHVSVAFDSFQLNKEIRDTRQEIINKLGMVVDTRLAYNHGHVGRVYRMSMYIGHILELSDFDWELLRSGASLHDIGLVGLPDALLGKEGPLTEEEYKQFQIHTEIGYELLKESPRETMQVAAAVAHQHHENYDGTGYPSGLAGEEINYFARIVQIADVIDFYGKSNKDEVWTVESLSRYLREQKGRKFDPGIIDEILEYVEHLMTLREDGADTVQEDIRV